MPNNTLDASHIQLLILDVDGVLTDGSLFYDDQGHEYKAFNSMDGHGMRMLRSAGVQIAILTGRKSTLVTHRAKNLDIPDHLVYQGFRDKRPAFQSIVEATGIAPEHMAYMGDDVVDLPVMVQVGLPIAVANAHPFVKQHATWVTDKHGGKGAVREVCERLLDARGVLQAMLEQYLT